MPASVETVSLAAVRHRRARRGCALNQTKGHFARGAVASTSSRLRPAMRRSPGVAAAYRQEKPSQRLEIVDFAPEPGRSAGTLDPQHLEKLAAAVVAGTGEFGVVLLVPDRKQFVDSTSQHAQTAERLDARTRVTFSWSPFCFPWSRFSFPWDPLSFPRRSLSHLRATASLASRQWSKRHGPDSLRARVKRKGGRRRAQPAAGSGVPGLHDSAPKALKSLPRRLTLQGAVG